MVKMRENLSLFDLTNIVIGGIVGADIYVASALSAGLVGPFSIFVWLIAGIAAIILALVFAYSSFYTPTHSFSANVIEEGLGRNVQFGADFFLRA